MKKSFLFTSLVLFLMICTNLGAQNYNLKWGQPFSSTTLWDNYRVLSIGSEGLVLLTQLPGIGPVKNLAIVKFDAGLNFRESQKIQLKMGDKNLSLEFLVSLKSHVLVFSSLDDLKAKKKMLYYQEFNQKTMSLSGTPVKLFEVEWDPKPFAQIGSFSYAVSPDSSKVALIYNPPAGFKSNEKFITSVLDDNLKILYSRKDELAYKDRDFILKRIIVSNSGKVFFSGTLITGPKDPLKREPNYKYEALMLDGSSGKPRQVKIDLKGKFITHLRLSTTPDDYLTGAGFYSETGTSSIKGCFSIRIDPETGDIMHQSIREFPLDVITAGLSEKRAEKIAEKSAKGKEYELYEYDLSELITRSDNGVILVGEQNYQETTYTTTSSGGTTQKTTYYSRNIIVVGFNSEGDVDMTKVILKYQSSGSLLLLSHVLLIDGEYMYFIFNDNPLNLSPNLKQPEHFLVTKKGIVSITSLDINGNMTRSKLYSFDKNPWFVVPRMSLPLDDGTVLLYTRNKGKARWCHVSID